MAAGALDAAVFPDVAEGERQDDGGGALGLGVGDHLAEIPTEGVHDLVFPGDDVVDLAGLVAEPGKRAAGATGGGPAQPVPPFGRNAPENRARLQTEGNQRARLQLLQPGDRMEVERRIARRQIHHLAARHARRARRAPSPGRGRNRADRVRLRHQLLDRFV